jgi:hypothetical protein
MAGGTRRPLTVPEPTAGHPARTWQHNDNPAPGDTHGRETMKNRLALALAAAGGYALGRVNKAALASAVVTKRLDGLADTLHERTAGLRDRLDTNGLAPLKGALPGTGDGGRKTAPETGEETGGKRDGKTGGKTAATKNSTRKSTARSTARSTAKSTAGKAAAKKPAARKSTTGKAPARKTTAKRTGAQRASSAKTGRTSGSGGGGRG